MNRRRDTASATMDAPESCGALLRRMGWVRVSVIVVLVYVGLALAVDDKLLAAVAPQRSSRRVAHWQGWLQDVSRAAVAPPRAASGAITPARARGIITVKVTVHNVDLNAIAVCVRWLPPYAYSGTGGVRRDILTQVPASHEYKRGRACGGDSRIALRLAEVEGAQEGTLRDNAGSDMEEHGHGSALISTARHLTGRRTFQRTVDHRGALVGAATPVVIIENHNAVMAASVSYDISVHVHAEERRWLRLLRLPAVRFGVFMSKTSRLLVSALRQLVHVDTSWLVTQACLDTSPQSAKAAAHASPTIRSFRSWLVQRGCSDRGGGGAVCGIGMGLHNVLLHVAHTWYSGHVVIVAIAALLLAAHKWLPFGAAATHKDRFGLRRMVLSSLAHADLLHLASNLVFLFAIGPVLHTNLGCNTGAVLLLWLLAAIGASLTSVAWRKLIQSQALSVGASGSLAAFEAVALAMSPQHRFSMTLGFGPPRAFSCLQFLATHLLLDIARSVLSHGRIDWAAHVGGAITGLAFAHVLYGVPLDTTTMLVDL